MQGIEFLNPTRQIEIYDFCKKNAIECSWDFNKRDKAYWSELYVGDQIVFQLSANTTLKQFIEVVDILKKDFDTEEFDIEGEDFWFNTGDKKAFDQFISLYGHLFKKESLS